MPSKAFKLAEAMVSNPVMSDMVENPTATPTQIAQQSSKIAAVETKTSAISDTGVISVNTKNIVSNNVLTQSFDSNQVVGFNLTDSINAVSPIVSVFKEVPQVGFSSKGRWDVNANATNYEFFDEKPLNYNTTTLTPSATGDGTFTSSNTTVTNYVHSKLTADNSGLSNSGSPLHTLIMSAGTNDNMGTLDMYGVWMSPAGDKILAIQVFTNNIYRNRLHGFNVANPFSTTDADITYQTTGNGYYDIADGTSNSHRNGTFGIDPTGTHLYTFRNNTLYQYVATTGWEASTFSFTNNTFVPSGNGIPPTYDWQCPPTIPSNNGDYLLFCSANDGYVARYTMTTAWDCSTCSSKQELDAATLLSNAGYTSTFFRSAQYNSDGTLLLLGNNDQFFKLSLSTPYDITTASFVEASSSGLTLGYYGLWITSGVNEGKYVVGQTGNVTGGIVIQPTSESVAFSSTDVGKKVVGNSGSAIITSAAGAYTSVATFADTSAISSWQLFGAEGKSDGTGIQLAGFSLPHTSIDNPTHLNTLTWNSSYAKGRAIKISPDGTNFYAINYSSTASAQTVHRFSLSTPFDISTATFAETKDSVGQIVDALWNSDGTKLFLLGNSAVAGIPSFVASTPYSLSNMTAGGNAGSLGNDQGGNTVLGGMCFNNDKTKLYISNRETNRIYEYDLNGSAGEIDGGLTFVGSVVTGVTAPMSIEMQSDGTKVWYTTLSDTTPRHHSMTLTTPFQISTAGSSTSYTFPSPVSTGTITRIFCFNAEQTKMYVSNTSTTENVFEFSIGNFVHPYSQYFPALTNSSNGQINSSSWQDINSMTADETKNGGDIFYAVSTDNRTSWDVAKGSDGVRKIARNNSGTWQYNNDAGVTVGYDIANGSYVNSGSGHSTISTIFKISSDGNYWFGATGNNYIYKRAFGTAYDVTTLQSTNIQDHNRGAAFEQWVFSDDGTVALGWHNASATYGETLYSTGFDLTTATASTRAYNTAGFTGTVLGNAANVRGIAVKPGTYNTIFLLLARVLHKVEFTGGSFLTGTKTIDSTTLSLDPTNQKSHYGIVFKPDGSAFYAHNITDDSIEEWTLNSGTTAWDLGNYTKSSNTLSVEASCNDLAIGDNGTKLYIRHGSTVFQYSIGGSGFSTNETWVNGTNNNEHATLQQALGAQSFNRMDKAQLDAVADGYHFSQDSADTLDLMIAPYAASGSSPISDGVTINYDAEAIVREAIPGTDYIAEFPNNTTINIKSLVNTNMKVRAL